MRRLQILSVILLCVVLGGCMAKLAYRYLDWLIVWSIDDYVSYEPAQEKELLERVQVLLKWHENTQLVRYRDWLILLRQDLAAETTLDQITQHANTVEGFWVTIVERLRPDFSHMLAILSDEQAADFIENLQEEQDDLAEEYLDLSEEKRDKRRTKFMRKQFKRWVGALTPEQGDLVNNWSVGLVGDTEQWLENRQHWINAMEAALVIRSDTERFYQEIATLLLEPEHFWTEKYRERVETNTGRTLELIHSIHSSLTEKQQARLQKNLNKWVTVSDSLIANGPAVPAT